ncbi:MAG TPA: GNAT family N-acetyltransferase, partial [Flavisolibacter sp.]|nr:GNAT family N-acetyltransferase [Flavisolibacter sp.]
MEIRTLAHTSISDITNTFNEAFSDYIIPLQFTEDGMRTKLKGEGVVPAFSIGAFDGDKLVGLILHGVDEINGIKTVYNAGTGVIPSYRGRGLTTAMYRFAIPLLRNAGIYHHVLEVIESNGTAKKIYDAVGFQTVRTLAAFRSTAPIAEAPDVSFRELDSLPSEAAFASMEPAWQNSTASINRDTESHQLIGAFYHNQLVGYAAYSPSAGRVKQCAVLPSFRRQKIATALFCHMLQNSRTGNLVLT